MDKILILDFGSQYTQLFGRRVRDSGVYAEILPGDSALADDALRDCKGIVLSGSPWSVYDEGAPGPDRRVYDCGLPVLGVCYGIQRMMQDFGGRVRTLHEREYGRKPVDILMQDPLLANVASPFTSWMSHGDSIESVAPEFEVIAASEGGIPAVLRHKKLPLRGVQFHPEVTHCEFGQMIIENFAVGICGAAREWSMERYVDDESARLRAKIGDAPALVLISGGVDSTVTAALALTALPKNHVHLMYIDTGMMRKNENDEVVRTLGTLGARHVHAIDAASEFLSDLAGVNDPEEKRRRIGDRFISIQEREVARLGIPEAFLVQGTLYTDLVESGKGVGKKAHVIKSHHNVRSPLVEEKRVRGLVVEPLDRLYKDEVRRLGRVLGLSDAIVGRHPFPGPGLGVRILGEVTRESCDILRDADAVYIEELKRRGLYEKIWQAFCVLLPIRSVGVAGDVRKYGSVVALRAVTSSDGMTADVYPFEMKDLLEISAAITNRVPQIGRVVYDTSSKPPATIEWE